ncbi:NlpC/P60 family protein [Streptomyces sp. ISL-100]|uniref:C40 family peptidase n=1 Tax=Streptomyces sp. ISL-100 TaxID=2819173 RepID=UPI001BEB2EF4|nr:NlpC/P60 family protein [Streptomyces sp. ISL-100]MBT2400892.1 C40 family peptidase [Streptomyces sp. ISL-100]
MNRRRSAATAIALICASTALTVLAAPGQAYADPKPARSEQRLQEVRGEIDALYRKAGAATDAYNLAEERADKQSSEIVALAKEIVKGQQRIDELKSKAGAEARAQYRSGGLPPEAQMMLSGDPQLFLDGAGRIREGQQAAKGLLGELSRTQADLEAYTQDATAQWTKLESSRKKKEAAKKEIKKQLAAAEKLEATLEKEERERLLKMEQDAAYEAQTAWLDSGALKDVGNKATKGGEAAVAYATAQIGKPYVWGAEGPGSFDCSGLTSQAWLAGGRGIPRTSQEQWKQLPRVAMKDIRPGDLIVYFDDASHIGMYVGDGAMVHAPRPGRDVTITGAGSMPILGVVRPDK